MRTAFLLLGLLAAPLAAQPSADLLARFDEAMNQPPEHNRVTREGDALVIRSTSCATTVPITTGTRFEVFEGGVNPYAIRIHAAGIRIACTSFQDDTDLVNYRFADTAARDAAVRAGQALVAGWAGAPSAPASAPPSAEPGEVVKRCVSGDCEGGTGAVEYVQDGTVIIRYTGTFQAGLPHGEGSFTNSEGDTFTGRFADGYEVHGVLTFADGSVYEGDFEQSLFHGQGRYTYGPGDFEGDVLEGTFVEGDPVTGTYTWADGQVYTGAWYDWHRHGHGTHTYTSGNRYEGEWADDVRHGRGTFTWVSGASFTGDWVDDDRVRGREVYANGNVYEGDYLDDKRHGYGRMTFASGEHAGDVYEGEWAADDQHGQGTYTWASGMVYTGAWRDGQREGPGTMTWPSGQRYEGEWHQGMRHGQGTLYYADGRIFSGTWADDGPVEGTLRQPGGEPRPVRVEGDQFVYTD